jgi:hypothetical protein
LLAALVLGIVLLIACWPLQGAAPTQGRVAIVPAAPAKKRTSPPAPSAVREVQMQGPRPGAAMAKARRVARPRQENDDRLGDSDILANPYDY